MERALSGTTHSIREFLPTIGVEYVPEAVMSRVQGADESFRNVNTPEEAARFAVHVDS
jgi:molybdopterin-guanine dinucleotide biosynthesis protein A